MLEGKVALVTGASRGIGRAILMELAKQGAIAIGTATSESGAAAIGEALAQAGLKGAGKVLDVKDAARCDALVAEIAKESGDIAVLVNNAAIVRDNLAMRMKDAEWDEVIETNLRSVFRLSRAVMRGMMKARWGRIISVTSVVGSAGNPGQANYAAAKAGIIGFTRAVAREVASRAITVNAVAPGFIETDIIAPMSPEAIKAAMGLIPLERMAKPDEVAPLVTFLAGDGARYITGQCIHVDGGMVMA